ncbi:MAG: pentapeptide repeat-containing protein [Deltaproteobacteria bacterium]|nr:pentapeptide repeat-containing protein [Deltaproteobacteria bacterium]
MTAINRSQKPDILFEENVGSYNKMVQDGKAPDLRNRNLSDLDLTHFNLKEADLSGCYLRGTNLKGLDLSEANLDGASIKNALISGTLFPRGLAPCEIQLSHTLGTRMRQSRK